MVTDTVSNAAALWRRYLDPLEQPAYGRKAFFLDRDGVLNKDLGYVGSKERIVWVPGAFEFCRAAHQAGYLLVVVTNQSGIGRGLYNEAEFLDLTAWFHDAFRNHQAPLASTWYCPHLPYSANDGIEQGCRCRKPKPGLVLAASDFHRIDLASSVMIGDQNSDILAGNAAGVGHCFRLDLHSFAEIGHRCRFWQTL